MNEEGCNKMKRIEYVQTSVREFFGNLLLQKQWTIQQEVEEVIIINCDGLWQDYENIRIAAYSFEDVPNLGSLS